MKNSKILRFPIIITILLGGLFILAVLIFIKDDFGKLEIETVEKVAEKQIDTITVEKFALNAEEAADRMKWENRQEILFVSNKSYSIEGEGIIPGASVENFKEFWEYNELLPYVNDYELTVMNICSAGSQTDALSYEEFLFYSSSDGKYRVDPRPKYIIYFGDYIFITRQDGGLWRTREQVRLERKILKEEKVIKMNPELLDPWAFERINTLDIERLPK